MALDFTQFAVAGALASMQRPTGPALEPIGPAGEPDAPQAPEPPPLADEIVGCRNLVELHFGRRVQMRTRFTQINPTVNTARMLIGNDPRRIRYELVISSTQAVTQQALTGTQAALQAGAGEAFELTLSLLNVLIVRDFTTDGDAVTEEVWVQSNNANALFSCRETLLTPLPVDES